MSTPLAPDFVARRSTKREPLVQPFLKWAGGKRQLLAAIRPLIPAKIDRYYEPFVGGGAVLFDLQPRSATINDCNAELVNCYTMIRDYPEELLLEVEKFANTREAFYDIREMDRSPDFASLPPIERAARLLYLNKTCYNGLFRVNSQGQFNVPFGNYKNPLIADPTVIRAVSRYLNASGVTLLNTDFAEVMQYAKRGDFVYMDPPYDPVSDTSSFTGYNLNGFDRADPCRLKEVCDTLTTRGVKVLLSNSDTPFIRELYSASEYTIRTVQARRNINSVAAKRGKVDEVFILNYSV